MRIINKPLLAPSFHARSDVQTDRKLDVLNLFWTRPESQH